ncbi:nucleoside diphosphate kinase 3-like protein [Dinothrombium tinctorium]|uniref:Nucleoside diphosphate kinase n=1 Tax=Dinothrombium tinctorium TaxID=1965070 RepID=A0A443RKE4_9ACAR|nr:nucleoside diphosphate kinase 3-like protein [Dinothrombium tinctorium]RWS15730.1 nucleoside diphosphate kinase 3-like protein [Dinothrombium tinctorium]
MVIVALHLTTRMYTITLFASLLISAFVAIAVKKSHESDECIPCANHQRTFVMIKPDAVQRELIGELITRFERKGLHLVAMKFLKPDEKLVREHYAETKDKNYFDKLIEYITSGPVVAMVWEGHQVVHTVRTMIGGQPQWLTPLNSGYSKMSSMRYASPGTIRGDYVHKGDKNVIHASDSLEAAQREIALWFDPQDLVCWKAANCDWI